MGYLHHRVRSGPCNIHIRQMKPGLMEKIPCRKKINATARQRHRHGPRNAERHRIRPRFDRADAQIRDDRKLQIVHIKRGRHDSRRHHPRWSAVRIAIRGAALLCADRRDYRGENETDDVGAAPASPAETETHPRPLAEVQQRDQRQKAKPAHAQVEGQLLKEHMQLAHILTKRSIAYSRSPRNAQFGQATAHPNSIRLPTPLPQDAPPDCQKCGFSIVKWRSYGNAPFFSNPSLFTHRPFQQPTLIFPNKIAPFAGCVPELFMMKKGRSSPGNRKLTRGI